MVADAAEMAAHSDFVLSAIKTSSEKTEMTVKPNSGFHINAKAPNGVENATLKQTVHPTSIGEDHATYILPDGQYLIHVYICDSGNTYCVKQDLEISISTVGGAPKLTTTVASLKANSPGRAEVSSDPLKSSVSKDPVVENGFFMNDLEFALARAKVEKKNILIDFSAIWCPACLKLEKDVFDTHEFTVQTKPLINLRVDLDWAGARSLRERYQIRDVPTVVVVDDVGEELGRIHGYRPKALFLTALAALSKAGITPLAELKARAIVGDKAAADRAGLMAYDALDFEAALLLWKDTQTQKQRRLAAEINLLSDDDASHAAGEGAAGDRRVRLLKALGDINKNYPDSVDRLGWLLLESETWSKAGEPEKAKAAATELLNFSKKLLANPVAIEKAVSIDSSRDDAEYTVGEVWAFQARAEKSLGHSVEEKAAWSRAIDETKRGIRDQGDKGRQLLLVRVLNEAGRDGEIDPVLEVLQQRYPTEYTFYYKRASRFLKAGQFAEAEKLARAAISHAYGTNWLDCSIVLAKTQKALGKTAEAKATAASALKSIDSNTAFLPDRQTRNRIDELHAI